MNNIVSFLRDTKSIGELSELTVALSLSRAGYLVSKPLGESTRYDLVIDKDGTLSRVQVKTGRLRNGVVVFNTYSTHYHRKGGACKSYKNDVDFFGIYCPQLHSVYLIPIADTSRLSGTIRVTETKNRQHSQVRWAQPYLIDVVSFPELVVGQESLNGVTEPSPPAPS